MHIIKNNLFLEYNKIKGRSVWKKLTILIALIFDKITRLYIINIRSNRLEWRLTCLEVVVKILARDNG
jgi:hypothetical protein